MVRPSVTYPIGTNETDRKRYLTARRLCLRLALYCSFLSRRPTEHAPSQQMEVEMVHRLARACVYVEHGAVSFLMDIGLHCQFLCDLEHLTNERIIVWC
jgi:hypothetical protein